MEGSFSASRASGSSEEPPTRRRTPARGDGGSRNSSTEKKAQVVKPRPYQVELLEDALCENTIVNLGTGAGKTFIAVMLIRELSYQILDRPFSHLAKRTVFLVCTVPLVKQQAEYLEMHTMLDIGQYIGDMNVDSWTGEKWREELTTHHVLVMTHTIFKNLLHTGFLHLKNVNLVVFDECHHAVKNHDYVQIMKVFDSVPVCEDQPRILGLSASLLTRKIKPGQLLKQVQELETTLKCRCQTARDYDDVALHATDPEENILVYCSQPLPHLLQQTAELREILESPLEFLETLPRDQREDSCYKISKASLDDTLHILENLGIWCARNCAEQCIEGLNDTLSSTDSLLLSSRQKSLLGLALTNINVFLRKARELHEDRDIDVTYKVQILLECLKEQLNGAGDGGDGASKKQHKMLGIVFVERRMTALLLKRMLELLTPNYPGLGGIKCDYVVGHNSARSFTTLRRESRMNVKVQDEVLEKFRRGKINLLIATSVVEEGIDVPRCNLVVRFDFPPNLRSYVQSKGRARAKPSRYILMIEDVKHGKAREDLSVYRIIERELRTLCLNRNPPEDEEFLRFLEVRECNIYAPYGREAGVRATLSSSLSFLYKYCQKFSDKFTSFSPVFECESRLVQEDQPELKIRVGEREFRSTVQLPISCPLRKKITGHWMPKSRRIADKSAALQAIRELHEQRELDEHLKPVTRDPDSEAEEEEEEERGRDKHAGTERRAKYYRDEVASSLRDAHPVADSGNHLYILLMEEADSDIHKFPYSLQPPQGPHFSLGLLSSRPLPHKQIPEFSLYDKRMEIRVKLEELSTRVAPLSQTELTQLQQCHRVLFETVLQLKSPLISCSFRDTTNTSSVLVVPLGLWQLQSPPLAHIDFEMAERVISCESRRFARLEWPFPIQDLLVTKTYQGDGTVLEVLEVNEWVTPGNEFPSDQYSSYVDYFRKKYEVEIRDLGQPALICKRIAFSDSRVNLLKSRFRDTHGVQMEAGLNAASQRTETLFPEVTNLYPIPASFIKVARCLPSLLSRIETLFNTDDLRCEVTLSTGVGSITTTKSDLRGYRDYGIGRLETHWNLDTDSAAPSCPCSDDPVVVRGPGNALLLQAVTLKSATDSIDNERLETLGDSFLKLATSVFLYCERPNAYEGRLTSARMRRIGNLNLFRLAKRRHMMGKIVSKRFQPMGGWVPPCFTFSGPTGTHVRGGSKRVKQEGCSQGVKPEGCPEGVKPEGCSEGVKPEGCSQGVKADELLDSERQYVYHRVTDKGAADFAESLIGAYMVAGGIEAAVSFMKWLGLKIQRQTPERDQEMSEGERMVTPSSEPLRAPRSKRSRRSPETFSEENVNLFVHGSPDIFQRHFGPAPPSLFDPTQTETVKRLLTCCTGAMNDDQISKIVRWKFRDQALLLQAVTHASYQKNRVTDCYQRLEFLGDAVLDYLITTEVYERFPDFDPGKITDMRSALVNNNLFAELTVRLGLHKLLLHHSPVLFRLIPEYDRFLAEQGQDEEYSAVAVSRYLTRSSTEDGDPESEGDEEEEEEEEDDEEVEPPKVLGDLLESLAGAIFMDSGMDLQAVWTSLGPLFIEKIEKFKDNIPMPPIKKLHESFDVDVKMIPAKNGMVSCTIKHGGEVVVTEKAGSRKAAKNKAARAALRKLSSNKK